MYIGKVSKETVFFLCILYDGVLVERNNDVLYFASVSCALATHSFTQLFMQSKTPPLRQQQGHYGGSLFHVQVEYLLIQQALQPLLLLPDGYCYCFLLIYRRLIFDFTINRMRITDLVFQLLAAPR